MLSSRISNANAPPAICVAWGRDGPGSGWAGLGSCAGTAWHGMARGGVGRRGAVCTASHSGIGEALLLLSAQVSETGRAALRGASSVIVDAQTRGTQPKTRAVFVVFCAITGLGVNGAALRVDKAGGAERHR